MEETFTLVVTGTNHHEWQGQLLSKDGEAVSFCNVLELLELMEKQLKKRAIEEAKNIIKTT